MNNTFSTPPINLQNDLPNPHNSLTRILGIKFQNFQEFSSINNELKIVEFWKVTPNLRNGKWNFNLSSRFRYWETDTSRKGHILRAKQDLFQVEKLCMWLTFETSQFPAHNIIWCQTSEPQYSTSELSRLETCVWNVSQTKREPKKIVKLNFSLFCVIILREICFSRISNIQQHKN